MQLPPLVRKYSLIVVHCSVVDGGYGHLVQEDCEPGHHVLHHQLFLFSVIKQYFTAFRQANDNDLLHFIHYLLQLSLGVSYVLKGNFLLLFLVADAVQFSLDFIVSERHLVVLVVIVDVLMVLVTVIAPT